MQSRKKIINKGKKKLVARCKMMLKIFLNVPVVDIVIQHYFSASLQVLLV